MTSSFLYLIQSTLVFSVFYLVFRFTLSRLSFHKANRWLLLALMPISLFFPFMEGLLSQVSYEVIHVPVFESLSSGIISADNLQTEQVGPTSFGIMYIVGVIYAFGVFIGLYRLARELHGIWRLRKAGQTQSEMGYVLIDTEESEVFSFFNWIFVPSLAEKEVDPIVLKHELAHLKHRHSYDVMATKLFGIFFWFNPLIPLYLKSLKAIHEYQADAEVLSSEIKTSDYLHKLLQTVEGHSEPSIYSYFNYPVLKKRINMMYTSSNRISLLQYLVLLPLFGFFLLAFSPKPGNLAFSDLTASGIDVPEFIMPVREKSLGDISAHFGQKRMTSDKKKTRTHGGIDIKASHGTPIVASADGVVSLASKNGNWGNLIVITHRDGFQTWYAHLSKFSIEEGQEVRQGAVIGLVGTTGLSTGPHLHFEIKQDGQRLDPIDFLKP